MQEFDNRIRVALCDDDARKLLRDVMGPSQPPFVSSTSICAGYVAELDREDSDASPPEKRLQAILDREQKRLPMDMTSLRAVAHSRERTAAFMRAYRDAQTGLPDVGAPSAFSMHAIAPVPVKVLACSYAYGGAAWCRKNWGFATHAPVEQPRVSLCEGGVVELEFNMRTRGGPAIKVADILTKSIPSARVHVEYVAAGLGMNDAVPHVVDGAGPRAPRDIDSLVKQSRQSAPPVRGVRLL